MKADDLNKIADTIANSIIRNKAPLPGCGSSSSSQNHTCQSQFGCNSYECGGAGNFWCYTFNCSSHDCPGSANFWCQVFWCSTVNCGGSNYDCGKYSGP